MEKNLAEAVYHIQNKEVFVWVRVTPNGSRHVSMKVGKPEAFEWAIDYANNNAGHVPIFVSDTQVFLGYSPML